MEDEKIVELFWTRSESAITEMQNKYGRLLFHISHNILGNREDADECVNDTYMGVWNAVPPERPNPLCAYICRIVRNISLKKYRSNMAQKRRSSLETSLEEVETILQFSNVEQELSAKELGRQIDCFLCTISQRERILFVRRYCFSDSIKELAAFTGWTENHVSVKLSRIRNRLKKYLEKEGYQV